MFLRKDIENLMYRTKRFYGENRPGSALIQVKNIESIDIGEKKPLNKWEFPGELYDYLDSSICRLKSYWAERQGISDDLIPSLYPWFGIAEHSAFLGGDVDFSETTSWHHPIIENWNDISKPLMNEENDWYYMIIEGLKYLKKKSKGQFAVKLRGAYSPLDLANALRGNDLFLDFHDNPEWVHDLLDFCVKAINWWLKKQKDIVGEFCGGTLTGMDIWLPGNSTGHFSEDIAALCSVDIFEKFGAPYTGLILKNYKHGFMHTHSLGVHTIPAIVSIPGIDVIEISSDPGYPRAIDIYKKLENELKEKIIVIDLTNDEMYENLDFFKDKRTIFWYDAADYKDAKSVVELVRDEFPV